jgi:hypothetical protein
VLELVRRDALAAIIPALPIHPHVNLKAIPVGARSFHPALSWPNGTASPG